MRTFIIGDLHINERAIPEIKEIFENDIIPLADKNGYDRIIQLGDWFDKNTPSPLELKYSSELVRQLKRKFEQVIILSGTGEHDMLRGTSVIEHLESLEVKVVKGDYIDNNLLYGHWMLHESKFAFGTGKCGIKDVAQYKYVFLGHQHLPERIGANIFHLGSIRYCSFNELNDEVGKRIALLEDNKISFIPIKHCIPMLETSSIEELGSFYPHSKVRFVINSFEEYKKSATILNKLGKGFFQFKIKMNFEESKIINKGSIKLDTQISKSNIIKEYINKIEDKDVKKLLEDQFKDNI